MKKVYKKNKIFQQNHICKVERNRTICAICVMKYWKAENKKKKI